MASLPPKVATYTSVVNMLLLALCFSKKFHGLSPDPAPQENFHSLTSLTSVLFKNYATRSSIYSPKYWIIISLCRKQDFKVSDSLKDTGLFSSTFWSFSICLCLGFRLFCPTAFFKQEKKRGSEFWTPLLHINQPCNLKKTPFSWRLAIKTSCSAVHRNLQLNLFVGRSELCMAA